MSEPRRGLNSALANVFFVSLNPNVRMMKNIFILLLTIFTTITFAQVNSLDSIWSIDMEDVVVTAQYAPTDSRNAVHSIRTIGKKEISKRGVINLEQLLRQELNIRISQDLNLGSRLDLQGISGQNIQIMLDGVPLIGRIGGDIDLGQINLHNIERVEIVDAPLSVNYGTNALGGVINLISKKSQLNKYETQIETQWESIGRYNVHASLGVRATKNFLVRINGGGNQFNGFDSEIASRETNDERSFQWNPKKQQFAGAMLRYDFGNDQQLKYTTNWLNENVDNLGEIRRPQFKPYAFDIYYHTQTQDHAIHQEGTIAKNFYLKTTLAYNKFDREKNTFRLNFDDNQKLALEGQQDTTSYSALIFRPVLASKFTNSKLNFQLGFDLRYETASGQRLRDENNPKADFSEIGDYAVFGSFKYDAKENLTLQLGLRSSYNTRFKAPVTPSLNIKYTPSKTLDLRASYAKGFRSPSLEELFFYFVDANHSLLGNTNLQAETSDNFQVAIDWKPKTKRHQIELSAAAFFNDIQQKIDLYEYVIKDGQIVPAVTLDKASTQYAYFNQDQYKTLGGNLKLNYAFQNFSINLGFSPIGRYNLLSETMSDVSPFTFVYESNGEISYHFPKQDIHISLYVRYNDKLIRYFEDFDENGNAFTGQTIQDGFTLADFTVSNYLWKKRIHLVAGIQNLFDVQDVSLSGFSGGAHSGGVGTKPIGQGRTFFVKMGWQFGFGK